ncbi:hypothetical protein PYCC9005_005792 [Savitreella phatthalungensis]
MDLEKQEHLDVFSWKELSVTVKHRQTGKQIALIDNVSGQVPAGTMLALMGPSGSGKTTLLNRLAHRKGVPGAQEIGRCFVDGALVDRSGMRSISNFVEQEDAFIGCLTVEETLRFSARFAKASEEDVHELLSSFGLDSTKTTMVGSPFRKGVSGGQKRRLGVACQLVGRPRILFLDEPTSGLDSTASYEVMRHVQEVARRHQLIVIASIHQPSTKTFALFDNLVVLSRGRTAYAGPVSELRDYLSSIGHPVPDYTNAAEHVIELVNGDFSEAADDVIAHWSNHRRRTIADNKDCKYNAPQRARVSTLSAIGILLHRSYLKAYRDIVAYWIRLVMYGMLAVLMGTVWLRLPSKNASSVQPIINALFFGGAFMSFMAVAYVPAVVEDLQNLRKERANGFYGPLSFMISNFIIGLPFLFAIVFLFSIISYWLIGMRPQGFGHFLLWLYLDLLAAESMVVAISAIFPIFVVALTLTAFANGLWMAVSGFLVPLPQLNVFYRYALHYIDYQAYVFEGMMHNEFQSGYHPGDAAVLSRYGITNSDALRIGVLFAIIAAYRLIAYSVLRVRSE